MVELDRHLTEEGWEAADAPGKHRAELSTDQGIRVKVELGLDGQPLTPHKISVIQHEPDGPRITGFGQMVVGQETDNRVLRKIATVLNGAGERRAIREKLTQ